MKNKLKIYSVHDKKPSFIELQVLSFKKFLLDDYEFIVCDNSSSKKNSDKIKSYCKQYKLVYISIPERHHENPNIACSYPLDYLMKKLLCNENTVGFSVFIDSDMFLIRNISFISCIGKNEIAGVFQSRGNFPHNHEANHVKYIWNALVIFNHKTIKEPEKIVWACSGSLQSPYYPHDFYDEHGQIEGEDVDVGGPTHSYLQSDHKIKFLDFHRVSKENKNINLIPKKLRLFYRPFYKDLYASDFLLENTIFHYRAGSNWNRMGFLQKYLKNLFLNKLMRLAFSGKL